MLAEREEIRRGNKEHLKKKKKGMNILRARENQMTEKWE